MAVPVANLSGIDPPPAPPPAAGECVVWWAAPRPWPQLVASLDPHEERRLASFARRVDRDRYATGCWMLRTLAGRAAASAGGPPTVLVDRACARCGEHHGRPRVRTGAGALRSSVTHAGAFVGVALTWDTDPVSDGIDDGDGVGIDVSAPGERESTDALAAEILTPSERSALPGDAARRSDEIARRWVAKEATLKAAGVGLRIDPRAVALDPNDASRLLHWPLAVDASRVRLRILDPGGGHVAALATIGATALHVRQHHMQAR